MQHHPQLLQAVLDEPDDYERRYVYSDWLEENGQPERAEFMRVQCRLERLPRDDPRGAELRKREKELRDRNYDRWTAFLDPVKAHDVGVRFRGGLACEVDVGGNFVKEWEQVGPCPEILSLRLEGSEGDGESPRLTGASLRPLLGWPNLRRVSLAFCHITKGGLEVLARLPRLQLLWFHQTSEAGPVMQLFADHPTLVRLSVWSEDLGSLHEEHIQAWRRPRLDRFRSRPPTRQRSEALAILGSLGDGLEWDGDLVVAANLLQAGVVDDDLVYFRGLPEVGRIELYQNRITAAGLSHLNGLPNLKHLSVWDNSVASLDGLRGMTGLVSLNACYMDVNLNDEGCAAIETLTGLETLLLGGANITDSTLERIGKLRKLKHLDLRGMYHITDAGLGHLAGLPELSKLELGFSEALGLTDAGLQRIAKLRNLPALSLYRGATDAGLAHLEGMDSLRRVDVGNTGVTPEGVELLRRLLPQAMISQVGHIGPTEWPK